MSSTTSKRRTYNLRVAYFAAIPCSGNQRDVEGSASCRRRDFNCPAVAFNDAFHNRQPQTAALPVCRKHRIENPIQDLVGNSGACILDGNPHVVATSRGIHKNLAAYGCHPQCIQNQIQEHSMQQFVVGESETAGIATDNEPYVLSI